MQAILIKPKRDIEVLPMLSNGASSVRDIGGFWTVAHCRSRHEKHLAIVAADAGFGFFLPMEIRKVRRPGHGVEKRQVPYAELDGHVFLSSTAEVEPGYAIPRDLHDFLEDQFCFFNTINIPAALQDRFIADIERLHARALKGGHTNGLVKGTRCRVVRGAFMGSEGVIDKLGKGYIQLTIGALGACSVFECPADDLEPI